MPGHAPKVTALNRAWVDLRDRRLLIERIMNMQNAAINWTAHKIVSFLNTAMNVGHAWMALKRLITDIHWATQNENSQIIGVSPKI